MKISGFSIVSGLKRLRSCADSEDFELIRALKKTRKRAEKPREKPREKPTETDRETDKTQESQIFEQIKI